MTRMRRMLAVLPISALLLAAFTMPSTARGSGRLPTKVVLEGEMVLDRSGADECVVAVPTVLTADLELTIDLGDGSVEGRVWQGRGSGQMVDPVGCEHYATTYSAEMGFRGRIAGTVDRATGEFSAEITMTITSATGTAVPDGAECGEPGCPLPPSTTTQTATITGRVTGAQVERGEFDWWTWFCVRYSIVSESQTGVDQSREICPTRGTWEADVVSIEWGPNTDPVIEALTVAPDSPTSDDSIQVVALADDLDGDDLSYTWSLNGATLDEAGPTAQLGRLTEGEYRVAVRVEDGFGGSDQSEVDLTVTVAEPVVPDPGEGGETGYPAQVGEAPAGSEPVFGVPPWLDPGVLGGPPVDAGDSEATATGGEEDDGASRWGALLLAVALILGTGALAYLVRAILRHRSRTPEEAVRFLEEEPPPPAPPTTVRVNAYFGTRDDPLGRLMPPGDYQMRRYSWWWEEHGGRPSWLLVRIPDGRGGFRWVRTVALNAAELPPIPESAEPTPSDWVPDHPSQVPAPPEGVPRNACGQADFQPEPGHRLLLEERLPTGGWAHIGELQPGTYFTGQRVGGQIPVYDHTRGIWGWARQIPRP